MEKWIFMVEKTKGSEVNSPNDTDAGGFIYRKSVFLKSKINIRQCTVSTSKLQKIKQNPNRLDGVNQTDRPNRIA
jgi:hypothetical protein